MSADLASVELPFCPSDSGIKDSVVLSSIISHITDPVFWKDRECRYLGCNVQFARLVGLVNPKDIIGLTDFDLPGTTEKASAYRSDDMEIMGTDTPKLNIMQSRVNFDGVKRHLNTSKAPLRNHHGSVVGIVGHYVDVSEKVTMNEKLAESFKLESIGQLAAGIAREIDTPALFVGNNVRFTAECFKDLMAFVAKAKTLATAVSNGDACSELATEVLKDIEIADINFIEAEIPTTFSQTLDRVERIRNMAQSLKEFSRSGYEQVEPVDINRLIRNTVTVATNEWRNVAQVELALDADLPLVKGVREPIGHVLLNLIVNAAHAIEEFIASQAGDKLLGKISISSTANGRDVEIKIRDTGSGIPVELHNKIFEPFFSTRKAGKGTGQGLSISHNLIVDDHGGSISFETEADIGTTFTILLPIEGKKA